MMKEIAQIFITSVFDTGTNCELEIDLRQPADGVQAVRLAKLSIKCERIIDLEKNEMSFKREGTLKFWVANLNELSHSKLVDLEDLEDVLDKGQTFEVDCRNGNIWVCVNFNQEVIFRSSLFQKLEMKAIEVRNMLKKL